MQATSRTKQSALNGVIERPSREQERFEAALLLMSTRLNRALSPEKITQWISDLSDYPIDEIEDAFDNWGRNAKHSPTLADILELISAYQRGNPEPEPEDPHKGKGYGETDVLWLLKKRMADPRPWDATMWEKALCELDKVRQGGAPEFHRGKVCFDEPIRTASTYE